MFEVIVIALLGFILWRSFEMSEAIDLLTQKVAETTALEASAVELITGIAAQLHDAAGDEAAVRALADQLTAGAAPLAAALSANTPAEPIANDETGGEGAGTDGVVAGDGAGAGGADETGAGAGAAGDGAAGAEAEATDEGEDDEQP